MIFCENCDALCDECLEDYCCKCRMEDPSRRSRNKNLPYTITACPECFPNMLELMKRFSLRLTLDKFLGLREGIKFA